MTGTPELYLADRQPVAFRDSAGFTAAINKMIAETRALAEKYKLIQ